MGSSTTPQKHFVLVHGATLGAWCWYKVKPLLEAACHKVTALDLSASGINSTQMSDIRTFNDYSSPLLELLNSIPPSDENKVILVGHSMGGMSIALAMDKFPEKILAGVFLCAYMPDTEHAPSFILDKYTERAEPWLDCEAYPSGGEKPFTVLRFGPKFLSKLYSCCSTQDIELATALVRPGSMFIEYLSEAKKLTTEGNGSIRKVYIVCGEDAGLPEEYQRWLIENGKVTEVMDIKEADHMPMLSRPHEVCQCLINVANSYN